MIVIFFVIMVGRAYAFAGVQSGRSGLLVHHGISRGLSSLSAKKPLPPPSPSTFPHWSFEPRSFFHQEVLHTSSKSKARVTRVTTPHGSFLTPSFVLVATNGVPKGASIAQVKREGQGLIFCNSYHLLLQPGPEVIREAGGIHKFMGMKGETLGPIITDR